jgi:hypothetical protein
MKKQNKKAIPKFKNEAQERLFWETHDLTDYFDKTDHRFDFNSPISECT